jgi:hypothetical protein
MIIDIRSPLFFILKVKNNEELNNFFIELNRRPEMYDLYTELLNDWEKAGGLIYTLY